MNTIHFHDVGRDKHSWSVTMKSVSESAIEKEVRKKGALMSRDIDCPLNDMGTGGIVLVGGWRQVGAFTVSKS